MLKLQRPSRLRLDRPPERCGTGPRALPKASQGGPQAPASDTAWHADGIVRAVLSASDFGGGGGGECGAPLGPRRPALRLPFQGALASCTQPESHAQHKKGEEKVTITTSATTSPRGNDHLTSTLHSTGGREDGEWSLVGLVNREPVLKYRG